MTAAFLLLVIGGATTWLAATWLFRRFGTGVGVCFVVGGLALLTVFPPAILLAAPLAVAEVRHRSARKPPREIPKPGDDQIGEL